MRGTIRYTVICGSLILAVLSSGCKTGGQSITYAGEQVPAASAPQTEEEIIYLIGDDEVTEPEQSSGKRDSLINPEHAEKVGREAEITNWLSCDYEV